METSYPIVLYSCNYTQLLESMQFTIQHAHFRVGFGCALHYCSFAKSIVENEEKSF